MIDSRKGKSHPLEVKMIRKNRKIVGKLHECRGFTLIELVVVMGVIGTLIAIAVPIYLDYKAKAHDLSAKVDNQNLVKLANQVILDYNRLSIFHDTDDGSVIGDGVYWSGHNIPKIYTLSYLVNAYILITNYVASNGNKVNYIYIKTYNEKGTDDPGDPFGLDGKKTYFTYVNVALGFVQRNF